MKNKLISIVASFFFLLASQLGLAAEGTKDSNEEEADTDESKNSKGGAAGDSAAASASGGIALGTVAAIAAIAAAALAIADSSTGGSDDAPVVPAPPLRISLNPPDTAPQCPRTPQTQRSSCCARPEAS